VDSAINLGELAPPIFMEEEQQGSRFLWSFVISPH